jgi:hypothetical protein
VRRLLGGTVVVVVVVVVVRKTMRVEGREGGRVWKGSGGGWRRREGLDLRGLLFIETRSLGGEGRVSICEESRSDERRFGHAGFSQAYDSDQTVGARGLRRDVYLAGGWITGLGFKTDTADCNKYVACIK